MTATLAALRISLPVDVIGDGRVTHEVAPEQLRIRDGIYSLARFDMLDGRRVFVISDLDENEGPSAMKASEEIATVILNRYAAELEPSQIQILQHFADVTAYMGPGTGPRRARITYNQWVITWRGRRAIFVDWDAVYNAFVH